jgi:hypothetical protein
MWRILKRFRIGSDQDDVPLDTEGIMLRAQERRSQPAGGTLDDGGRAGRKPL